MERVIIGDKLGKINCGWKAERGKKGRCWIIYSAVANTSRNVEIMLVARVRANTGISQSLKPRKVTEYVKLSTEEA